MLCCCRCFRRPKVYDGPLPDDGEKGPIVVKEVIDDGPTPPYFGRPITHMESIPEASPRPSDDIRDRAAAAPNKPVPMPTAEEETSVPPVQRSASMSQNEGPSTSAPSRPPTETSLTTPDSNIVAPLQRSHSASVPPLQTVPAASTPPIKPPTPSPTHPTPPVHGPTPSHGPVPGSVQHTSLPLSRSPLRTPTNVPTPNPQPKIDEGSAPPHPSLFTRIKTMILPSSEDEEGVVQNDGTVDRRALMPRVAVRPSQKRTDKAAVPNWSTEVWF
jgi:hypothetical protein